MRLSAIILAIALGQFALASPSHIRRQAYGPAPTESGPAPVAPSTVAIQTGIGAILKARLAETKAEKPDAAPTGEAPAAEATPEPEAEAEAASKENKNADASKAEEKPDEEAKAEEKPSAPPAEAASSPAAAPAAEPPADGNADLTVLNFALIAEQLESAFYQEASKKISVQQWEALGISGAQASLIAETLSAIARDEATHISGITGAINALGGTPVSTCSFNFGNALDDPLTFLSTARALEAGGVGAYLGAANLISDKSVLTVAGSILTIEARHQSLLNLFAGAEPITQAFDIAMTPQQVLALIGGFISGCAPSDLGLVSNQALVAVDIQTQSSLFSVGSHLAFASSAIIEQQSTFCQMLVGGAPNAIVLPLQECIVPDGVNGPVAIFVTKDDNPLAGNVIVQDATTVIAGPALAFVDNPHSAAASIFGSLLQIQQLASANLGLNGLLKGIGQNSVLVGESINVNAVDVILQKEVIIRVSGQERKLARNAQHQWQLVDGKRKRHASRRRPMHK